MYYNFDILFLAKETDLVTYDNNKYTNRKHIFRKNIEHFIS